MRERPVMKMAPLQRHLLLTGILISLCSGTLVAGENAIRKTGTAYDGKAYQNSIKNSVGRVQSISTIDSLNKSKQKEDKILKEFENFHILDEGTSSSSLRKQAIKEIPYRKLSSKNLKIIKDVIGDYSQYRRLPKVCFETHISSYDFFTTNPDIAVGTWRALNISKMKLWEEPGGKFACNGGEGTVGELIYLLNEKKIKIVYSHGSFKSPLVPVTFKAKCIFILHAEHKTKENGLNFVTHHADVFVSFPNMAIENAARLITPISNMIADRNFREVSLYLHTMSLAMSNQPSWVYGVANKLEGVGPGKVIEFKQTVSTVFNDMQMLREKYFAKHTVSPSPIGIVPVKSVSATGHFPNYIGRSKLTDSTTSGMN